RPRRPFRRERLVAPLAPSRDRPFGDLPPVLDRERGHAPCRSRESPPIARAAETPRGRSLARCDALRFRRARPAHGRAVVRSLEVRGTPADALRRGEPIRARAAPRPLRFPRCERPRIATRPHDDAAPKALLAQWSAPRA